MITIPSNNVPTFEKVLGSLGGENYSYYVFDVKHIEEPDSKKKVQIALKVFVDKDQRLLAVDNIQDGLNSENLVAVKNAKGTSLDVTIPNSDGKVIRIEVKPANSKGSGGGAEATKLVESAQCVYAAMRYYCGDVKYFTDDDFKCGMKYSVTPGVGLDEIKSLPKIWQDSSWAGAQEIFKQIGGKGWTFVRGDDVVEKEISEAFKRVKGQTNLSSEDKWNPADIWMVKDMKKVAKKLSEEGTIDCLNNFIQQARVKSYSPSAKKFTGDSNDPSNGDLVGISLKKIEGKASMKLLNDDTPQERKKNEQARYVKYDLTFDNKRKDNPYPMDVYFYYGSGTFEKFQARNFGGPTKGDWKLELKGKTAAQGKIQGAVVRRLLDNAGFNVSTLTEPNFNDCEPGNTNGAKKITEEIYKLLNEFSAKNFIANVNTKNIIADRPQAWRYSKLAGLRMLKWLKSQKGEADRAMKELYLYASSQSDKSSVYYKLM